MRVSWTFFRMLGVQPALGRDFRADDDNPNGWHVVVVSDALWRRRFDADPSIVGRVITMNDTAFTIGGVMPPSFEPLISEHFYKAADMWAPVGYERSQAFACRTCQHLHALGRLAAGASIERGREELDAVHARLRDEFPSDYERASMTLVPLRDELTGRVRPVLLVLSGAVAAVLLIACANVASLHLARLARREQDLALRTALGASGARLIRQLLAESGVLAAAGGAAGIAICAVMVPLVSRLAPATMARLVNASIDGRVLAFSTTVSLATAALFGLLPALRASRPTVGPSLHADARRSSRAPTSLARRLLVAGDVVLAVVLLVAAGLMIKSVGRLLAVDPGFDPDHVLSMATSMVGPAYAKNEIVEARTEAMVATLRALPGVAAVAAASQIPLGGNDDCWGFHVQGRIASPSDPCVERYGVTPDYFSVMRIPLHRGRLFTDADRAGTEPVMLVGAETARALWPGADPIGQHVRIGPADSGPWRTVVGVVGDVRHRTLASPPTLQMYTPQAQLTDSFLTFVIRSDGDAAILANEARRAIWSVAGDVPVSDVSPVSDLVERSVAPRRFVMLLLELFGLMATVMTAAGLYGVISYAVAERTREIAIRVALGASRADIVRLVVGSGTPLVAAALGLGVVCALGATRYLEASLYGISATDMPTFMAVIGILFAVSLAAQGIPVARAMRVDPAVALRQE
jgi:putative ABC transport system permease protein